MNLNNLEELIDQCRALGVSPKNTTLLEEQMRNGVEKIQLDDIVKAPRGQVEVSVFVQQSGRSENYYLNKFQVAHNRGMVLAEDQKYFVTLPEKDGKPQFKTLENTAQALELFKSQKGDSELRSGKSFKQSGVLARMEHAKVNYVHKDFQRTYNNPSPTQTFWIDKGKSFTIPQAVNLIQSRYVLLENLLNSLKGEIYAAWNKLDFEAQKDRFGNYPILQYAHPNYGFDQQKELAKFDIKELEHPVSASKINAALQNGDRVIVEVSKNGESVKMGIENEVRYGKINFYDLDGVMQKREQFLKVPGASLEVGQATAQDKEKAPGRLKQEEVSAGQEMGR